jgi:hypothetical protein
MDEEKKGFGDLKTKLELNCNKIKHVLGKGCGKVVPSKRFVAMPCARFMNCQALRDNSM